MFPGRKPNLEEAREAFAETKQQQKRLLDSMEDIREKASSNASNIEGLNTSIDEKIIEQKANESEVLESENTTKSLKDKLLKIQARIDAEIIRQDELIENGKKLDKEKLGIEQNIESLHRQREELTVTFQKRQSNLKLVSDEISRTAKLFRKARFPGPEKNSIKSIVIDTPSKPQKIVSLGDIHGWAPGLIRHFSDGGFATVEIGSMEDIGSNQEGMEQLFQNPLAALEASLPLPRVGFDGHPVRKKSAVTSFHEIVATWNNPGHGPRYIQIGDLIDRGDHSELAIEIMRQACITSSGRALVLMGNHEEIVIEGVFKDWVSNEKKFMMDRSKQRPGVISHDTMMTGAATPEESFSLNFESLVGGLSSLLLSQHIVLYDNLDDEGKSWLEELMRPTWRAVKCDLDTIRSLVDGGGWKLHQKGWEILTKIRKASKNKSLFVPGALISWYESGCLLIHAEPNGLSDLEEDILNVMTKPLQFSGNEVRFSLMALKNGKATSKPICWARGAEELKDGERVAKAGIERFSSLVAPIKSLVHGHSPRAHELRYEVETKMGKTKVFNIDEGMTPVYYFDAGADDAYNSMRIPSGVVIKGGDLLD